jgi:antitoxin component YwqK of YwqJK toxin-antitoxin module
MKTKTILLLLLCLSFSTCTFFQKKSVPTKTQSSNVTTKTQNEYADKINQYDNNGQKEGFWSDTIDGEIIQCYYKNGVRSGVYKWYSSTGNLFCFGEFENGQMSGTWFYFDVSTGHLWFIFKNFEPNTDTIYNDLNEAFVPDHKCYSISYHLNGNIEDEGTILWYEGDDPTSDLFIEYGEWKYYDEDGNLIKTKIFDKTSWVKSEDEEQ